MIEKFHKKCVISGKIIEFYEYENLHISGFSVDRTKVDPLLRANVSAFVRKFRHKQSNYRSCKTMRGLVNANAEELNKFVTLTFAKNEQDLSRANYEFKKFIQRLKRQIPYYLKYVCVVEFQKRGAVHYHLIMNLPYFGKKKLEEIWTHGFVQINRIDNVQNIGAYFSKHGTKGDDVEAEKLSDRKKFFRSKNLKLPIEYCDDEFVDRLFLKIPDTSRVLQMDDFKASNGEKIKYTQFRLVEAIEL